MVWIFEKLATVFDLSLLQTKKQETDDSSIQACYVRQQGCENIYTATTSHARPDYVAHPRVTFFLFHLQALDPTNPNWIIAPQLSALVKEPMGDANVSKPKEHNIPINQPLTCSKFGNCGNKKADNMKE